MGKQVTASKTPLLLQCSRPFAADTDIEYDEPSEPARYGSAFHEVLELNAPRADAKEIAAKYDVDHKELYPHAVRTLAFLKKWLAGDNVYGEVFTVVGRETHRATLLRVFKDAMGSSLEPTTRVCDFDADTHTYDLRPGEFGGTDDLVVESYEAGNQRHGLAKRRIVIDYKSGDWGEFHKPSEMAQMLTLALQTDADAVAILHSPREGVPVMFCDDVSPEELSNYAKKLRGAMRRIGDGSLRPGALCNRCDARIGCPAGDADLLKKANALIKVAVTKEEMGVPLNKGQFHMFLQQLERLAKRAREVLREDIRNGEIIVRPDGQVLVLRPKSKENLSKSSIVAALGKQKGEAQIKRLRDAGCITSSSWDEIHAVKES